MTFNIDTESGESLYIQIHDQIIVMIANGTLSKGDILPSVRELATVLDINFHTVNKAYALLRDEGYLSMDPRSGTTVECTVNKRADKTDMEKCIRLLTAKAKCKNIPAEDIHKMIDVAYGRIGKKR